MKQFKTILKDKEIIRIRQNVFDRKMKTIQFKGYLNIMDTYELEKNNYSIIDVTALDKDLLELTIRRELLKK